MALLNEIKPLKTEIIQFVQYIALTLVIIENISKFVRNRAV